MKPILLALAALSCLALVGCNSDPKTEFAKATTEAVCANWDPQEVHRRGSKLYQENAPKEKVAEVIAICKEGLGPLKSLSDFTAEPEKTEGGRTTVKLTAPAQFEKGAGTVEVTLAKEGEKWALDLFNVQSPALLDAIRKHQQSQSEAQESESGGEEKTGEEAPAPGETSGSTDDDAPASTTGGSDE